MDDTEAQAIAAADKHSVAVACLRTDTKELRRRRAGKRKGKPKRTNKSVSVSLPIEQQAGILQGELFFSPIQPLLHALTQALVTESPAWVW